MARARWHSTEKELPPVNDKFSESEELLCIEKDMGGVPFVGWYNGTEKQWFVCHHSCNSIAREVSHWRELPKPPSGL